MKGGKIINKDNDNFNGPFGETTSYVRLSLSEIKKLMNRYNNLNCALCQFSNYADYKFRGVRYQEEDMKVRPLTSLKYRLSSSTQTVTLWPLSAINRAIKHVAIPLPAKSG